MIELKEDLQTIAGGVHPHLLISALGTIGVLTSLYLIQKNGASFTQLMCHVGCAASGGIGCFCIYSSAAKE